jgi:hypothetical protein
MTENKFTSSIQKIRATEPTKITHDSLSPIFDVLHTVHFLTFNTFTNTIKHKS